MLSRGEKIEELADKTRNLDQQAFIFNSDARALKNQMWWQNTRYMVFIAILVVVIILVLVLVACGGPSFSKCKKSWVVCWIEHRNPPR